MAATAYADLVTLKKSFSLEVDDMDDDALLTQAIEAASRGIDDLCGRRFWRDDAAGTRRYRTADRTVWTKDGHLLLVDDIATDAGLVIETGPAGGPWTALSGFETTPDNAVVDGRAITGLLLPSGCWPCGTERVRVTAQWGWPALPAQVVQACLIQAARLFRRKDSPEGVTASSEWGPIRVTRVDPDVQALLQHFVLPGFG